MPVVKYIQNLKEKPESHRRRFQFLASIGVTAVIFAVWAVAFSVNTTQVLSKEKVEGDSPFSLIRENVSAAAIQVKDGFVIIRDSVGEIGQQ